MKNDFFALIIALMIIALVGIIGIQLLWLKNAINIKQAQTDSVINEALAQVVEQVETYETVTVIAENVQYPDHDIQKAKTTSKTKSKKNRKKSKTIEINSIEELDEIDELGEELEDEIEAFVEELSGALNFQINITTDEDSKAKEESFKISSAERALVISKKNENLSIELDQLVDSKKEKVDMVVQKLITEDLFQDKPLIERVDTITLLKDMKKALVNKGLNYDFDIAIVDQEKDSVVFSKTEDLKKLLKTKYKTELFPNDILDKDLELYLEVKGASAQIYKSMMLPLIGSGLFSSIILIVFIVTLVTIHRQKKTSDIKNDFINNMTHEFKTPIATISLAIDSIENDKIISDADKIKHFTKIIREENNRMNYQVENVLQASLLDKEDFDLRLIDCDVEPLINKAIHNISMQVEKRGGKIEVDLVAESHILKVDEVHFVNVINNLLDNANKYSNDSPEIILKTKNQDGRLMISVEDKGIGMSKEVKQKIFEKFYRQTHGNIHNVKGFGLGLSYVWALVSKFNGEISVESELGSGSMFILEFPLVNIEK